MAMTSHTAPMIGDFDPELPLDRAHTIPAAWYHHPEDLPADMDQGGLSVTAGHKPHDPGVFAYSAHAAVVAVDLMRNLYDFQDTPVASGLVRSIAGMFGG